MTWNACLYWYSQERGGTCFTQEEEGEEGVMLLDDPKGPILVQTVATGSGSRGTVLRYDVMAAGRVSLERPYRLRIKGESILREGIATVLRQVDRLGGKGQIYKDYGAPELAAHRGIKTNEPEFTRWVLKSFELQKALLDNPDFSLRVERMAGDSLEHLVSVGVSLEKVIPSDSTDYWQEDRQRELYEGSSVRPRLDAMVALVKTARDAVLAWPMPFPREQNQ